MKSQLDMLLDVCDGLFTDIRHTYADYPLREFEHDKARLLELSEARGLGLFTLDLPSMDSCLLLSLKKETLSLSGPLSRRRSKRDRRPTFLWYLWTKAFDSQGCLKEHPDPNSIFFLRSLYCIGKKIEVECAAHRIKDTMDEYYSIESEMRNPSLGWDSDCLGSITQPLSFATDYRRQSISDLFGTDQYDRETEDRTSTLLRNLDLVSGLLVSELGYFHPIGFGSECPSSVRFKHGPGAVADSPDLGFKYEFQSVGWPKKLDGIFPFEESGVHSVSEFLRIGAPINHERPSRLLAVPKTAKGPRLIAAEPTSHQWAQQYTASWLRERMKGRILESFIDFHDQGKSAALVAEASAQGHLATVDLSSASDRLSCHVVERVFRSNETLLRAFHSCRTRWVCDTVSLHRNYFRIKKFAAQGSALTFPVQSIVFLAIALASCGAKSKKDILGLKGKVRIYGDDIIIPVEAYEGLETLMTTLGLKVNLSKSYATGSFRESCGSDYYSGYDVTPVKPKSLRLDTPSGIQSLIDTANNLFRKGLWYASDKIVRTLRELRIEVPVVNIQEGVDGLHSYVGNDFSHLRMRWSDSLHRWEIRTHSFERVVKRKAINLASVLLQYFTEDPDPLIMWKSGLTLTRKERISLRWRALPSSLRS